MRTIFLFKNLFLIFTLLQGNANPAYTETQRSVSADRSDEVEVSRFLAGMTVSLNAATEATILFKSGNGQQIDAPQEANRHIPYLVLTRNGVPTPNFERTLHISLNNLQVPPSGLYASLEMETQHSNPDLGRGSKEKIRVWEDTRFISPAPDSTAPQSIDFTVVFQRTFEYQRKTIQTPTDYYSYRVTLSDSKGNLLRTFEQRYAFLLENQWRVPLPKVLESTPGAAPQELVLYYYDMIPFQASFRVPESRIPRQDVGRYIQTELIPAMTEAFKVQTDLWKMPWYEEWTNYRSGEDPKALSVALNEHGTWFHGAAPSLGHAMISIRVDGSFVEYATLTDGIMSVFHHELFHNQQRNISLHFGAKGHISGMAGAWEIFSEGTAVLASLVGQPSVQMTSTTMPRSYLKRANAYIGADGIFPGGLNMSYTEIPYHTSLYWRFLYEQCGGIQNGREDPAAGMQVIRQVLETLYSGEITDINTSTSAVGDLPQILDIALSRTPTCPFDSYKESLVHFTRAIYQLRLTDGRCQGQLSSECGFFDPDNLYSVPGEESYAIVEDGRTNIDGSIRSSFGMDLIRISTAQEGKSMKIFFRSVSGPDHIYNLELWTHQQVDGPIFSRQARPGVTSIELDESDIGNIQDLDMVVTRLDTREDVRRPGQYTIQVIVK